MENTLFHVLETQNTYFSIETTIFCEHFLRTILKNRK